MTYATAEERDSLIAGLRELATFLEAHPRVPAPRWADMLVFPPETTDKDMQKEVARIAALIGSQVDDATATGGHYTTSRSFGPVQYRAVAIPLESKKPSGTQSGEVV